MSADPVITDNTDTGTPDPTPTPEATPEATPDWRAGFSADIRDHPAIQRLDSVEAGMKELVGAQKFIGADKVVVPGADSTQEDKDAFFLKLGRPAEAKDYDLEGVEVPEGLPWDEDFQTAMLGTMHELGLNSTQAKGVLSAYIASIGGQYEAATGEMQRSAESARAELQNEWGKGYAGKVDMANRALMAAAGESYEDLVHLKLQDGSELGSNPMVVRAFAELGGKMSEHGLVGGTPQRSTMTPGEATAKRNELRGDPKFMDAYMNKEHPEHAATVQRMDDLAAMEVAAQSA